MTRGVQKRKLDRGGKAGLPKQKKKVGAYICTRPWDHRTAKTSRKPVFLNQCVPKRRYPRKCVWTWSANVAVHLQTSFDGCKTFGFFRRPWSWFLLAPNRQRLSVGSSQFPLMYALRHNSCMYIYAVHHDSCEMVYGYSELNPFIPRNFNEYEHLAVNYRPNIIFSTAEFVDSRFENSIYKHENIKQDLKGSMPYARFFSRISCGWTFLKYGMLRS